MVEGIGDHGCEYMTGGRVVVLGRTGRNFAAGMSGGVAYVLNPTHAFERRCNPDMVDLEPLDEKDVAIVRGLIERHVQLTGSRLGARLLSEWDQVSRQFTKVMPRDYKRALATDHGPTKVEHGPTKVGPYVGAEPSPNVGTELAPPNPLVAHG